MKNLDKTYDPKSFEDRIYKEWEEDGDFIADAHSEKTPFTISMPPPNVTGKLHMGHALVSTLQDIMIRWKRMMGYEALWVPGTDHASISTEAKVVEKLKNEGISKQDIGREKFLEECWKWTDQYGGDIRKQLRKLGVSCDWSRERFTLDEGLSRAVYLVFKELYDQGWIYRGDRIVNWCPHCRTAISDIEVNYEDENSHLWYIRYPIPGEEGASCMIATTRPETIFGDLAIAVNPEDSRYKDLVGKRAMVPVVDREIPIIADDYVDVEYGTGCVKITPSHDPNDFLVGQRHGLGQLKCIDEDGKIMEGFGKFSGMDRYEARKAFVQALEEGGYLDHIEDLVHAVGHCSRCGTDIEPLLSKQWFVKMDEYIKGAGEALDNQELQLVPSRFDKIYKNWVDNIHDWTISRQLWWGHRIPVWYCDDCGEVMVVGDQGGPEKCTRCGSQHLHQDPDTLDTWFSSALWPFSTLGWPEKTADFEKFYPTTLLMTGYDIIFFWVIRMVFSAKYFTGKSPFSSVYFNGLVRDEQGRKMSKSLGNGIDPLEVIDQYGADALRFTLVTGNTPGNDTRFSEKKVMSSRNFANKLWNATRFVLMNLEEGKDPLKEKIEEEELEIEDQWILSTLHDLIQTVNANLDRFEIGLAAAAIYEFIWFQFCDWYVEFVKPRLYGDDPKRADLARSVLCEVLSAAVRLLHPFMPFITEEIWQTLPFTEGKIIKAPYPKAKDYPSFPREAEAMELAVSAIVAIRNERQQRGIVQSKKGPVFLYSADERIRGLLWDIDYEFVSLASASEVTVLDQEPSLENAATVVLDKIKIFLPLKGLVDYEGEYEKLSKALEEAQANLNRVEKKLSNPGFIQKAPQAVVQKEEEKRDRFLSMIPELEKSLEEVKKNLA